jgi:hypothetical protein
MSIRDFTRQPCPDCRCDTVHIAMKCRECGHINLTPTQQRVLAVRKMRLEYMEKYGSNWQEVMGRNAAHTEWYNGVARRKKWAALPSVKR